MASRESTTLATVFITLVAIVAGLFWWDHQRRPPLPPTPVDLSKSNGKLVAVEPEPDPPSQGHRLPTETHATCQRCGERIEGREVRADGLAFHPRHFVCKACGKPIATRFAGDRQGFFHANCLAESNAPRCAVCADAVLGGAVLRDYWGNSYHATHRGQVPECEYCQRFFSETLGNVGRQYDDGRQVCSICLGQAVTDLSRARELMMETARALSELGVQIEQDWIELQMVDRNELARVTPRGHQGVRGVTKFATLSDPRLDVLKRRNRRIYILAGMPELETRATLAHELTHVWQGEFARLDADPALAEGSCNYAAFLVLGEDDSDRARYLMKVMQENPDPIYGGGFRRVQQYAQATGGAAWVDLVRREKQFPSGY